ncbi:MAG: hypothetical protein ACREPP_06540 [Rhodanobacteraceae bacterium]
MRAACIAQSQGNFDRMLGQRVGSDADRDRECRLAAGFQVDAALVCGNVPALIRGVRHEGQIHRRGGLRNHIEMPKHHLRVRNLGRHMRVENQMRQDIQRVRCRLRERIGGLQLQAIRHERWRV